MSTPIHLAVVLGLVSAICPRGIALAQVALPEQRLSTTISTRYHDPQLRGAGSLVVGAWGGADAYPHNVSYGFSLDRGATWSSETSLPLILGSYGALLPIALALRLDGTVDLMTQYGSSIYFRKPVLGQPAWIAPVIAELGDGSGTDVRSIDADPDIGLIASTYTHQMDGVAYPIRIIRSLDNGATWSAPTVLSSPNCNGSSMVVGPDGTLYVTWVDYALGQILLRRSLDHGATFSPAVIVAGMLDNLTAPPVGWTVPIGTFARDYPYYRSGVATGAPNFPALAVDRSNNPSRGTLYLTWAERAEGSPAPATSVVGDQEPNDSSTSPQVVPIDCDIVGSVWSGGDTGPFDYDWFAFDGVAGQTIVLDGSVDDYYTHGPTLWEQLPGGGLLLLDFVPIPGTSDPLAHQLPAVITLPHTGRYLLFMGASAAGGYSYALRLRTWQVAPASVARDMRDIVLIRSTDGGATWSPKVRVNHDPAGADQHQPNVAVDGQGRVYVAWYDRRGSAYGNEVRPYAAVSVDGGATFGPDLPLREGFNPWDGSQSAELIGDRIALAAGDDFGMVAWTDFRDWPNRCDIYAARIVDVPTAVAAVSDLAAEPVATGVRLRCRVNDPQGLSDLEVLRSEGGGAEALVGTVTVTGSAGEAEYVDVGVEPGREYRYRLQFTAGGEVQHLGPIVVRTPARITALAWRATGPNPFAGRATVTLAVPRAEAALVRVYDVQGKVVRTLHEGLLEAGERQLEWDGRDAAGADAAPGLYFVAAQAGGETARAKLTRVR